ncbi:MAG: hypothetical protein EPO07_00275 [Verrucomicrobia bacterium]|nr:MAG: hypothetical protein EPO07_00275 [Verrucomicrobiota bacterium]
METKKKNFEATASSATIAPLPVDGSEVTTEEGAPDHFRLLKSNELVSRGDVVANEHQGFELWEGPSGFRADAFVKPIYRRDTGRTIAKNKS